ncbi:hypothetical protein [Bradyrhizobium stylosanthis]|uniref:Uncharacterized protein n=1 Tax=Bradyrhizobium stylosanthis TaxID=1803665 RepID=A0A560D4J0_9BRAD|nr:hypothetical protein [Bradyrhizobium stylosanthis]TWA92026.1 hypothetical protein FBZ96_11232 [Bradyrhizobium stylosanthis]
MSLRSLKRSTRPISTVERIDLTHITFSQLDFLGSDRIIFNRGDGRGIGLKVCLAAIIKSSFAIAWDEMSTTTAAIDGLRIAWDFRIYCRSYRKLFIQRALST